MEPWRTLRYHEWAETIGKYRWVDKQGEARTFMPLIFTTEDIGEPVTYDWTDLFNKACRSVDTYYAHREIFDPVSFTDQFIGQVAYEWEKFKNTITFLSGSLTGQPLDPQTFNAGYERKTSHARQQDTVVKEDSTGSSKTQTEDLLDGRTTNNTTEDVNTATETDTTSTSKATTAGTHDNRGRAISYQQGVTQKGIEPGMTPENIGEMGAEYASAVADSIDKGQDSTVTDTTATSNESSDQGQSRTSATSTRVDDIRNINTGINAETTREADTSQGEVFAEHVIERRINMYDNIAYLRLQAELAENLKSFVDSFADLFVSISFV